MASDDDEISGLGETLGKITLKPTIFVPLSFSPPPKEVASKGQTRDDPSVSDDADTNGTDDSDDEGGVPLSSANGPHTTTSGAQQSQVDLSYVRCVFDESETPVDVTFNEPNNAFCFGLYFIDCTFAGPVPLCFHNSIVRNVVFKECHFELTRFSNCVLEDMKVVDCVFENSWWFNRVFTEAFITFTSYHEGKREGAEDDLPEKLETLAYRDSMMKSQRLPSEIAADEAAWHVSAGW